MPPAGGAARAAADCAERSRRQGRRRMLGAAGVRAARQGRHALA